MRRRLGLLAGLLVLVVGADLVVCNLAGSMLERNTDRWAADMRAHGWEVTSDPPVSSGSPWSASLVLPNLIVAGGRVGVPGSLGWHAERVVLSVGLFHPLSLLVSPEGEQTVRISSLPDAVFTADTLSAAVPWGRAAQSLAAQNLDVAATGVSGGLLRSHRHQDVQIGRLALHLELAHGDAARIAAGLRLEASAIGLPDNGRWPLGATIAHLAADAGLASPALSGQVPAEQARAWRDWGGQLDVRSFDLRWGPLSLAVSATLNLDRDLQPAGHGRVQASGTAAALDALADGGRIEPGVAQTAKAVLSLMAHPGADMVDVPLTLQDSVLSVGKIPLVRVGRLDWTKMAKHPSRPTPDAN